MDVNFDFFHVEAVKGKTLTDALNAIRKISDEDRHGIVQDRPYRISHLARDDDQELWTGDFVRMRMRDLPGIGDLNSDSIRDIDLQEDEGVSECACFAFSEADDVLILQRKRLAVGSFLACPIIRKISKLNYAWAAAPVPRPDAVAKLEGAKEIKNLVVKFARVRAPELLVSSGDGDKEAIKIASHGVIPTMKIQLSNGQGRGSKKLDVQSMIAFAKRMCKMSDDHDACVDVDDLRIKGIDEDGDVLNMKLLDYQLSFQGVASDTKTRRIAYSSRKLIAEQAFQQSIKQARRILREE